MSASPFVLTEFLKRQPADHVAVVLPEQNISVTYGGLLEQVNAVAGQLAAAGVGRGDRVATSLTNGLPVIVSFLAAGLAGTAAPLNPAYKEDEFRFFLEDTAAKVLLLPPDGADEARRAAIALGVPILTIDMDAAGTVRLSASDAASSGAAAATGGAKGDSGGAKASAFAEAPADRRSLGGGWLGLRSPRQHDRIGACRKPLPVAPPSLTRSRPENSSA
jgi:non-ribosomal peptide synthetase component E (peptide arylation enzyme)